MFGIDWQTGIALLIVAAAILYLCLRLFGISSKRKSGCGTGCGSGCGKKAAGLKKQELVQIGDSRRDVDDD